MSSSTIDLGSAATGARGRQDLSRRRRRPPWTGSLHRRVAGIATAAVLLGGAAAADATPPGPALVLLGTVPAGDSAVLTGDTLYVQRNPGTRGVALAAYQLRDATTKWEITEWVVDHPDVDWSPRADGESMRAWLRIHDGVPLVTLRMFGAPAPVPDLTTAYDPDSGHARWTREGRPAVSGAGDVLVLLQDLPRDGSGLWPRYQPVAVDLVTGEQVWTAPAGRWQYDLQRTDRARHLVNLDQSGRLTVYDVGTGARRSATIDVSGEFGYQVIGELVLMYGPWDPAAQRPSDGAVAHAYDVETLTHLWTVDLPDVPMLVGHCGSVMCMQGPAMTVYGLDPATGDVRWSIDRAGPDGAPAIEPGSWPWPYSLGARVPDALVLDDHVVDSATGEPLLPLAPWGQEHDPALRTAAWHLDPVLIWHPPREIGEESRTWFARLHSRPLGLEVLGSTARTDTCRATAVHIVCRHRDRLEVWHLRD